MAVITHVGFNVTAGDGDLTRLEQSLAQIADLGADVAELSLFGHDLIAGGRVIEGRAKALAEICAKFPLRYTAHGQIVSNFMDPVNLDRHKAVAGAMLELCERVGATVLVQHCGSSIIGTAPYRQAVDRMEREALAEMAEIAKGRGVRIAFENIFAVKPDEYRQSPAEIAETVRAVAHPNLVGLIDFGHAYIEGTRLGLDWREEVRTMAQVTGHLHLHDNFGLPYTMSEFFHPSESVALGIGDLHLPLGWGDIPFDDIFAEIDILPGTALIMEIGERFATERAESLDVARRLAATINARGVAAAA
ncbi:xylose isomerase [Aureimonas sp. SA4125]|uniref:sugar phosphate isomerase/epimerase family protein n=1 Tax=Aureimonas sp. SA4125 TaxID=2826993 RepID=UPI001CC4C2A8|nr:sugar phosphate isomerase/epimerase [Aureimonas sp. SA4125]BDA85256.1 xylose isomerase [Aureimonas sp. SA4125]